MPNYGCNACGISVFSIYQGSLFVESGLLVRSGCSGWVFAERRCLKLSRAWLDAVGARGCNDIWEGQERRRIWYMEVEARTVAVLLAECV
jgi:hypothetical protein